MVKPNRAVFPANGDMGEETGYGQEWVPRAVPPETPIRQPQPPSVADMERQPLKYVALALTHLKNEMANMARMTEDRSRPVDEYQPQEIIGEQETVINIQPQWETTERITSVLITGPAGSVVLQLGDRVWSLTIPAAGFIIVAPISIFLARSDTRQLTAGSPGQYCVELMGYCDTRAQLI